ncbi:MAG: hypothetical protein OEZ68_18620 [Gammaproteobacteria bacterium]|nr:hypothetical protein [Gammaproteobacteria bacterium]MDH5802821.1 hypothetical protein [Gammaproteobacteria bacterium]
MSIFTINQLITLIQALKHYETHLEDKLEDMDNGDDEYGITADEMVYVRELLPKVEEMHEQLYKEKFGESS